MMEGKMTFLTHVMQSFIGKRVEVELPNTEHDGERGILKSYVIERDSIAAIIQVRTLIERLLNREGKYIAVPFESIIDLHNSTPLDIYALGIIEEDCELDEDGDEVDVDAYKWDKVRRKPTNTGLSEEEMEEMYQEFYEGCPCHTCEHSGSVDSMGDNSPCLKCVVADHCSDVQSLCLDCKYHGLTYPKED
jgi:hypothetical protein